MTERKEEDTGKVTDTRRIASGIRRHRPQEQAVRDTACGEPAHAKTLAEASSW